MGFAIIGFLDNFYPIAYNALLRRREVAEPLQNIASNVSLSTRVALLQRRCGIVWISSL